jgi:hypothetical protein
MGCNGAAVVSFFREIIVSSRRPLIVNVRLSRYHPLYYSHATHFRIYGIAIYIYYRDHNPPHFHAIYGESEAIIEISTGGILEGQLPRRAAKLVAEWCEIQRDALLADWALAQAQQPLLPIEPLD